MVLEFKSIKIISTITKHPTVFCCAKASHGFLLCQNNTSHHNLLYINNFRTSNPLFLPSLFRLPLLSLAQSETLVRFTLPDSDGILRIGAFWRREGLLNRGPLKGIRSKKHLLDQGGVPCSKAVSSCFGRIAKHIGHISCLRD